MMCGVVAISISGCDVCTACSRMVTSGLAYQAVTYTEWHIPDDVLIQLILLMMSTVLLKTYREVK
jgi:hypothetical protein